VAYKGAPCHDAVLPSDIMVPGRGEKVDCTQFSVNFQNP
jgi:hypothetical protein